MFKSEKRLIELYDNAGKLKEEKLRNIEKLQHLKECNCSEERFLKAYSISCEVFKSIEFEYNGSFVYNSCHIQTRAVTRILSVLLSKKLKFLEKFNEMLLQEKKVLVSDDLCDIFSFLRCIFLRKFSILENSKKMPVFLKNIYKSLKNNCSLNYNYV